MIKKVSHIALIGLATPWLAGAQTDSASRFQLRFQQTVVTQYHPSFAAVYSGVNSLRQHEEAQTSLTTTLFTGIRMTKYTFVYFNPEIAGGAGLSRATGIAGFPNGETFRVGDPKPQVYVARLFLEQFIPIGTKQIVREDDYNSIRSLIPENYIKIVAGRFAVSDHFDNNSYSHDPRTQFLNWSLMGNGAYDYSANTRGYTYGVVAEAKYDQMKLRYGATMVPNVANASVMDADIKNSLGQQGEIEYRLKGKRATIIRALAFVNKANMGNYQRALMLGLQTSDTPDVTLTRAPGTVKFGFGLNIEKEINDYLGAFLRAGYNNGKTETWMFTEIDNTLSAGVLFDGAAWKRNDDVAGVAFVSNGIASGHRKYLEAGGSGFMVGDGALSYSRENIIELFYKLAIHEDHFFISPDYQFVMNPAYNMKRGPVNIFALRVHTKF